MTVRYVAGKNYNGNGDYLDIFPELIVEVLSPSTKMRDRMQKTELYLQAKITHYWLVDPEEATIDIVAVCHKPN